MCMLCEWCECNRCCDDCKEKECVKHEQQPDTSGESS